MSGVIWIGVLGCVLENRIEKEKNGYKNVKMDMCNVQCYKDTLNNEYIIGSVEIA